MSRYNYRRRESTVAKAGNVAIGGENPIRLQSMTNTSTLDTAGSVAQALRIAEAGGEIVRLTTQGVREAENMAEIRKGLDEAGCGVPLVADVHFNPNAAFKAAETCEKVRINPGNFVDAARTFRKLEFTDEEYAEEVKKIDEVLVPFLNLCKANNTAVRLGVNHGSLSDRIMSRYGDTPAGMVES
ncbi:MAG: flavodoxin-dependent (E)-4-hydroxy-3-methylbut-2-enyl-diphosphate synthase, partial [Muribaculaceae bacterium]|nr:flavodoxin-dependent (E)-4-hydroxy-3-methylbut-2-enyl-diphosphate synthase [Muribaculaceae bacterium]